MESELKRFLEERGYKVPNASEVYSVNEEFIVLCVVVGVVIAGLVLLGLFT